MLSAFVFSARSCPKSTVAVSCSKNFGLYRERTGALHVVSETKTAADAVLTPTRAYRAQHLLDAAGSRRGHRV